MTDTQAVLQLVKEEPSNETLLGRFKSGGVNTAFPLALIGTFPEEQTNLPAISIRRGPKSNEFGVKTSFITVQCYAATEFESEQLADAVNNFFRDSQGGVDGFAGRFDSDITGTVNDADQSGTVVELKVTSR